MPFKGKYDDGSPAILRKQLDEMKYAGISFIAFDTYPAAKGELRATQAIDAYLKVARSSDPRFTVMWDNSTDYITSMSDWDRLMSNLVTRYLSDRRAFLIDGKPVVTIYRAPALTRRAKALGASVADMLQRAQMRARAAGLKGIFFIAGSWPRESSDPQLKADGYGAVSAYNLGVNVPTAASANAYAARDGGYRKYWAAYEANSVLPVVLPITVGWDRSPWGGSEQGHALASAQQFSQHMSSALSILARGENEASRTGIICCWNEYGEGSVLEPTVKYGDAYIETLRSSLAKMKAPRAN